MTRSLLALFLVGCSGAPVSAVFLPGDAGEPRETTRMTSDASRRPEAPTPPPPEPDASETTREAGNRDAREAGIVDRDAKPGNVLLDACVPASCSGFVGACAPVASCGEELSCGACPSNPESACGDNGDPGVCGNACLVLPPGNAYRAACASAGLSSTWVVTGACEGIPWSWDGSPVFRPTGRAGCVLAPFAGDPSGGVPANAYCCP